MAKDFSLFLRHHSVDWRYIPDQSRYFILLNGSKYGMVVKLGGGKFIHVRVKYYRVLDRWETVQRA